ncbi:class I SAM-dependent methyltransferase [Patescibacteria group bacterium]|nr:class I SAM-dependent methyltransferase [Patescibacteria group bacterium]
MSIPNKQYDYGQKYKMGGMGRLLIDNFYQDLRNITEQIQYTNCLDVGCGEGYSTQRIFSFIPPEVDFQASEYEKDLTKAIKSRNPSIKVFQEDIYNMQRPDNSLDLIFCLEVLEHLAHPQKALAELYRVCGNYLILSVPNEPLWRFLNICRLAYLSDWGNTPGHIHHWSENSLTQLVSEKFNIVDVKKPIPWIILLLEKK